MHSLKNTIIAVGLLGLSFVFYQMSSPDQSNFEEIAPPIVTDLHMADAGSDHLKLPRLNSAPPSENGIGLRNPLASRPPNNRSDYRPSSPKVSNPLAAPAIPQPKLNQPKSNQPKLTPSIPSRPDGSFDIEQPEFKPRPEAEFEFTGKSGPALTPPAGVQQRDQGLINALKKQQAADGSQSKDANQFQANAFVAKAKTSSQSASFVRDPEVVGASRTDDGNELSRFQLQPENLAANDSYADLNFKTVWPVAESMIEEERFRKPLELLTRFYDSPGLSGPQQQRLNGWLDSLAVKVVFSDEHHLAPAYVSEPGDNLLDLGREWGVPGQLIYNVNKVNLPNPSAIAPGTKLKKISGPINATVDLSSNTMTLFVEGLYAGRFNVVVGTSGLPRPGDFKVVGKLAGGHDWKDINGSYPPGHPNNHYGKHWIAMEGSLCMHSVPANTQDGHLGCLGLSEKDAEDVFSILSEGSTISIQ